MCLIHIVKKICFCVIYFCTINDFSTYGNLSDYSMKGHFMCSMCEENMSYTKLKHEKRTIYIKHQKFIPRNHP